jgi:hypothetical protein
MQLYNLDKDTFMFWIIQLYRNKTAHFDQSASAKRVIKFISLNSSIYALYLGVVILARIVLIF